MLWRPLRPYVNPRPRARMLSSRRWRASRRASHFLSLSPEHVRANSPVEFVHEYLYPSPEARDAFSFGLDDVLFTAASDSEDFGPALADAILPSGQVVRPSTAHSELVDVLSRSTISSQSIGPMSPRVAIFETR